MWGIADAFVRLGRGRFRLFNQFTRLRVVFNDDTIFGWLPDLGGNPTALGNVDVRGFLTTHMVQ